MYCKGCGKKFSDDSRFCDQCGEKIEIEEVVYCTYCGEKMSKFATSCPHCSRKVFLGRQSNDFQTKILCIFSFLIPVLGFIIWLVLLAQSDDEEKIRTIFNWSLIGFLFWIFYHVIF